MLAGAETHSGYSPDLLPKNDFLSMEERRNGIPEHLRPVMVGDTAIIPVSDKDGSFFPEIFSEGHYEHNIRTDESLADGQNLLHWLSQVSIDGQTPYMSYATGRAVLEDDRYNQALTQGIEGQYARGFTIGGDGTDFLLPEGIDIDPYREELAAAGFKFATLYDPIDGQTREVLVYGTKTVDDIRTMINSFQSDTGASFVHTLATDETDQDGSAFQEVAQQIHDTIHHADVDTARKSCIRGGSGYCLIEDPAVAEQLTTYAESHGMRVTASPHVTGLYEVYGEGSDKGEAMYAIPKLMRIVYGVENTMIYFGGNGGNDKKAIRAIHHMGGKGYLFRKETAGELFVDTDDMRGVQFGVPMHPHAQGWFEIWTNILEEARTMGASVVAPPIPRQYQYQHLYVNTA